MYIVYLDESGDPGTGQKSPTDYLVLSCVAVPVQEWLAVLDKLVGLRRWLRTRFQIPSRQELKGNQLAVGGGTVAHLPPRQRMWIFRRVQEFQSKLPIRVFAVAIEKVPAFRDRGYLPRVAAWTFALQRINRMCGEGEYATLVPDEGQFDFIRRKVRAMRRYHTVTPFFGGARMRFDLTRIIEDPSERSSSDSYFVQLADLNAYAAHRSTYVDPRPGIDPHLWDALGSVLHLEVNKLRMQRGPCPPAIVKYP